jgi:hypothetical protein
VQKGVPVKYHPARPTKGEKMAMFEDGPLSGDCFVHAGRGPWPKYLTRTAIVMDTRYSKPTGGYYMYVGEAYRWVAPRR